jgi:hypothetical protein
MDRRQNTTPEQGIRDRVVMPVDLDMVIDVDASVFPLGVFIRL